MRRSAINFTLPVLCALLAIAVIDPVGRADDRTVPSPARVAKPKPVLPVAPLPAPQRELLRETPRAHAVVMEVTAYCPCKKCCGPKAKGITASGKHVSYNAGQFVAADTSILPFDTKIIIPGYASDEPVKVLDRGGAIKGRKLDVFFASHKEALKWGRRKMEVIIFE